MVKNCHKRLPSSGKEAAHSKFAAGYAHDDLVLEHQRRGGHGVAQFLVGDLYFPDLLAGRGIECDQVRVKRGDVYALTQYRNAAVVGTAAHRKH
jgi:hypothetical protein